MPILNSRRLRVWSRLSPWLDQVVVIGGWAHRLHRLHPAAQALDYAPLQTLDADVALPTRFRMLSRCFPVMVCQNPSRLLCSRSSATYRTRFRVRSFTSVRYLCPFRIAFSSTPR